MDRRHASNQDPEAKVDKPITADEARDYLWDAICKSMEINGLVPCAPSSDGPSGLVMDFQRRCPGAYGIPHRFRIKVEPVEPSP